MAAASMFAACGEGSPASTGDGGWDEACPLLEAPENGSVSQPTRAAGETATYACDEGYSLSGNGGSDARDCLADLTWSGSPPICAKDADDRCPALDAPESGAVDVEGQTPGEAATYECDDGYSLVGEGSRVCLVSLEWSGAAPTCVLDECPALDAPEHGAVSHPSRVPGESATYTCDEGFELVGEGSRLCEENLAWSGAAPTCSGIQTCDTPGPSERSWFVSALVVPQGDPVGFDLDQHNTEATNDPVGCGQVDYYDGIDNVLSQILDLLGSISSSSFDPNASIAAAIADGSISFSVEMKGYDGPDDEFVVLSLFDGGTPIEGAQNLCVASDADGSVRVSFPALSFTIPDVYVDETNAYSLTIPMTDVVLEITDPWADAANPVLGGRVLWKDAEGNGIHTELLEAMVAATEGTIDPSTLEGLLSDTTDLGPDGACDTFSFGMSVALSPPIQ